MKRRAIYISRTTAAMLVLLAAAAVAGVERENKTTSLGALWSSAKEDGDDFGGPTTTVQEEEERHLDGGFSTLEGMLQWSIGHSDPKKLKEAALDVERLSSQDLMQRQVEIKELMEKLKTPSDAELMKIAINDLNNLSLSLEDRHRALQELLILVEPIDNANDLHKLGGLTAVIKNLNNSNPEIRTISAWILGKASQNNPFVQNQILELGALAKLMEMAHSEFIEEAIKALYAISALIRNNFQGQQLFYKEAGDLMLQKILSNSSIDIRLQRKSVFLLADLVDCQLQSRSDVQLPFSSNHILLKSVVDLTASADLDLQEKALYAVKSLLMLRSTDALVFKDICELDLALERMKQQLQQLILDDKLKEYALDIENLRKEVEIIFLGKLEKAKPASTQQMGLLMLQ
ncbi:hsp70 nucleotide exchange factor FES1-like [Salvia miltiorrhiza]|uniref:hsp70 nucleotide exchange factor FES1-like n=1 Tax=Salvia miltiorrhiza TaxID=226208 RepID=UPI0025AD5109|nr:hsp70 nucleotide exchange factor FES1-like [Salvia miltiorrhiza]XP_057773948.1 hsp70 nucleotide exchange factor FES1-like [Salvia miltiorrhiza]